MSVVEKNKALVRTLLDCIERGGDISCLLSDELQWWVPDDCPLSGSYSKAEFLAAMAETFNIFAAPPKFRILHMTAEGRHVAVDCLSTIVLPDGQEFQNSYHFLFELDDGKIVNAKEFLNTATVNRIFLAMQHT